jgi:hypothetical protein
MVGAIDSKGADDGRDPRGRVSPPLAIAGKAAIEPDSVTPTGIAALKRDAFAQ